MGELIGYGLLALAGIGVVLFLWSAARRLVAALRQKR